MQATKDKIFRIYLSHSIRGINGTAATQREIAENIAKYIAVGTEIKAYLIDWEKMDGLPSVDLYVPAEHDEFVMIAYNKQYIDETQILSVDCDIIARCDILIAYGDYTKSRGMAIEIEFAEANKIPIYYMPDLNKNTIASLKYSIQIILGEQNEST